jgi:predicted anti-sigma-YlaC factor YlaD
MTQDAHKQAREWIACTGAEGHAGPQQTWLQSHLEGCPSCREYADAVERLVRSLRAVPLAADRSLVRSTQMRVRVRARELRQRRERFALVVLSCALVAISSALTTMLVWQGFAWLGRWNQLPNPVWQAGYVLFWIAPTIAAGVLFLAHGTHLSGSNGASRG